VHGNENNKVNPTTRDTMPMTLDIADIKKGYL
jgi:hypothetical protein